MSHGNQRTRTNRFEPVTLGEIKELAGVGRPTVSNWRRRHASFPAATGGTESKPLFDAEEVAEWLDTRPVPDVERRDDGRLPTYGDRFREALRLRRLVALKHDGVSAETLIRSALAVIADKAAGGRQAPAAGGQLEPAVGEQLQQAVAELLAGTETPGAAADAVLGLAGRLESDLAMDATPPVVADLIGALVRRTAVGGRPDVINLHAGTGDLLFALDWGRHGRITAVEADGLRRDLLGHRLLAHGVQGIGRYPDVEALRADGCTAADVVVADPPYAAGERETDEDGPLSGAVEALGLLAPGGTAYVVVPSWTLARPRTTVRGANVRLREYLLQQDAVAAIVQLPRRIHPFRTGAELALLLLRRDAEPGRRGTTRVVDGDRIALRTGLGERWTATVAQALSGGDLTPEEARDIPVTAEGPRGEQMLDGRSLLPAHRLASPERGLDHFGASLDARREVAAALPGLREWIGGLGIAKRESPMPHRRLDEHVRAGQLKLFPGHRIQAEDIAGEGLVVIGRGEMLGALPIGGRRITLESLARGYPQVTVTERGDVLLLTEHGVRTHVDDAGGCVLLAPVQGLRITAYAQYQEQRAAGGLARQGGLWISPHPLARLLAAPRNQQRSSGSLVRRVSVRDMDLPQLPPEEITELEAVLAETDRHRAEVRRQLDALDALAERLAAGVADGALALRRRPSR